MWFPYSAIALSVLFACAAPAFAQTDAVDEDMAQSFSDRPTVSIATGSTELLRRAPAVATVITAADITRMGASDLDEVLETVPGVHVSRSVQNYAPLYLIRGIYSDFNPQTLVLLNGIPLTTLFVGNRGNGWSGFPLSNVERIEIIRGSASALYGADAYSGVINIITKKADDINGTEFGLQYGSNRTGSSWVQHGGRYGAFDVATYFRAGHTDGSDREIESDTQTRLDTLFGTHASLAPGSLRSGCNAVDAGIDVGLNDFRFRSQYTRRYDMRTGPGIYGALDDAGRSISDRLLSDVSWNKKALAPDLDVSASVSYMTYVQDFTAIPALLPPGAQTPYGQFPNGMLGAPETWERQTRLSTVATYSGFSGHRTRIGFGYDILDLYRTAEYRNFSYGANAVPVPLADPNPILVSSSDAFLLPQKRTVTYQYIQDEWTFAPDWTLTGGLRRDHYSDFGDTTNPRVALVWDASVDLTAKLLYGQAFRAPAFVELYSINNPVVHGNPSLEPEKIRTLEAAFSWQAQPSLDINLSLFTYRMKDMILLVDTVWQNGGAQTGRGFELEGTWKATRSLTFKGNFSSQRSVDDETRQDTGYAPHTHVFFRGDWLVQGTFTAGAQINYVAGRKRAAGDTRDPVPNYSTVDLNLRSGTSIKGLTLSAGIQNLFNVDAREPTSDPLTSAYSIPRDLPLPERTFFLRLNYSM